jgi:hypothetical protein
MIRKLETEEAARDTPAGTWRATGKRPAPAPPTAKRSDRFAPRELRPRRSFLRMLATCATTAVLPLAGCAPSTDGQRSAPILAVVSPQTIAEYAISGPRDLELVAMVDTDVDRFGNSPVKCLAVHDERLYVVSEELGVGHYALSVYPARVTGKLDSVAHVPLPDLRHIGGIAIDSGGLIYLAGTQPGPEDKAVVAVYRIGSDRTLRLLRTLPGSDADHYESVALADTGRSKELYVFNDDLVGRRSILRFDLSNGTDPRAPAPFAAGPALRGASAIAVDEGILYVAKLDDSVDEYAADGAEATAPVATIGGPDTGLANPTALAAYEGRLYAANYNGMSVTVFPRDARGNVAPDATVEASFPSAVAAGF